jgi:SAM-dependent methyltransferase
MSVVTLARGTRFLDDSLESLRAQTKTDWEWILLAAEDQIWRPATEDPRLRIIVDDQVTTAGSALRLGCSLALGETVALLGEGSLLSSDALERIAAALANDPDVGFTYGDGARLVEAGTVDIDPPDPAQGWHLTTENVDGRQLTRIGTMEPTPHNVSTPRFAPRYGRAFRRAAYERCGGHDPQFDDLADEDLTCRLFQQTEFRRLPILVEIERLTRRHERDRPVERAARLAHESLVLYDRAIQPNTLAWTRRHQLLALEVTENIEAEPGYLPVRSRPSPGEQITGDLVAGLDLADSSVGVIRAVDSLSLASDRIAFMNEAYRLLAHGGMLLTLTPSADGRGAFQDPRAASYWNENAFWYFADRNYARFVPPITARFQVSRLVTYFPTEWHEQHSIPYVCANLVAVKDGPRQGGEPGG